MDVEAAEPGASAFEPNPSVYARNNDNPDSVRGAFQVGLTAPPRMPLPPPPSSSRDADMLFLSKITKTRSAANTLGHSKTAL